MTTKILITGATGFIGNNLLKELINCPNFEIAVILRSNNELTSRLKLKKIYGDLNNIDNVAKQILEFNPDICIHLSWEGLPDYSSYYSLLNLNNSINLVNLLTENTNVTKLIFAGSCFEYGKTQGVCNENDVTNKQTYFGWSKNSLYEYANLVCDKKKIDLLWIRIFYVYGPGQRASSLIPTIISSLSKKQKPIIKTPANKNDFIYIKDLVHMLKIASNKNVKSGIYNAGTGNSESIVNIYNHILKKLKLTSNKDLVLNNTTFGSEDYCASMDKTNDNFNWLPSYTLKDGIEGCLKYYIN